MQSLISSLIERAYPTTEVARYEAFKVEKEQWTVTNDVGKLVVSKISRSPGQCVPLNVVWCAILRDRAHFPAHAVVGDLFVDGVKVYGEGVTPADCVRIFSGETIDLDWNGHCWMMLGDYVCDASIFDTAESPFAHRSLRGLLKKMTMPESRLLIANREELSRVGLRFVPNYVLDDHEVSRVCQSVM